MPTRLLYLFLAILFTNLISCDKGEDEQIAVQQISISNHSDIQIDTVTIETWYSSGRISFSDINTGSKSDYKNIEGLSINPVFIAKVGGKELSTGWDLPIYIVDASGLKYHLCPSGRYDFSVIECDTVTNLLTIGLIEFRKQMY